MQASNTSGKKEQANQLTPKSGAVKQFTPQQSNQGLSSIKEVDQSASFGERSQVDPQRLNFENSALKSAKQAAGEGRAVQEINQEKSAHIPRSPGKEDRSEFKISLMFKGKLQEYTWSGRVNYQPILERIR